MKLKDLEILLDGIEGFEEPKICLEQYETSPHIGSRMLFTMNSYEDIDGKSVLDLGTGCGRLGLGCVYLNAAHVLAVDIDQDALAQCSANFEEISDNDDNSDDSCVLNFEMLCADVCDDSVWHRFEKTFNVVVMNPPFGTKNNKGIDMIFLKRALQLSTDAVYSLHKSSTRDHILKKAKDLGVKGEVLAKLRYDLPNTYKFHKKQSKDIEVDFYRFEHI